MNQLKIVAAGDAALALSIIVALAQGSDGKLAARSPPAGLEPYADATLVMQNARRVIGLLGTATFDVQASEQRKSDPECNSEAVQSCNRGYLLAHSGSTCSPALRRRSSGTA